MHMAENQQWWRGGVIYQVYPRSFYDASGDGVGDLKGVLEKLDYIADLGVDALWLSPFFMSPMKDFGYDVSNYRDVDPLFGHLEDFDRLIARAHQLNLKVMIDQVLSHTSDQHAWFAQSRASRDNPKADWYVWADAQADGSAPNNWRSVFGGSSWTWDTRRKQYYLHNFLAEQPDLNYHNPQVQQQILSEVEFWLKRGVDGIRIDTANYFHHDATLRNNPAAKPQWAVSDIPANPYDMQTHVYDKNRPENIAFFERLRALLDQYGAASVGEIGDANALDMMVAYSAPKRLHMTYSFGFLNPHGHANHVRQEVQAFESAATRNQTDSWPCWTLGNHDAVRVLTRWNGVAQPDEFTRMAGAMISTLRGSVCWYQGDELSLEEADLPFEALQDPPGIAMWPAYKGRDGCRTPMPWQKEEQHAGFSQAVRTWLPVDPQHQLRAVDVQAANPGSALHFLRAFWTWRKQQPALWHGTVTYLDGNQHVLALIRRPPEGQAGASFLCVFNMSGLVQETDALAWPTGTQLEWAELPSHQVGCRRGSRLSLPPYGIYFAALQD